MMWVRMRMFTLLQRLDEHFNDGDDNFLVKMTTLVTTFRGVFESPFFHFWGFLCVFRGILEENDE